MFKHEKQLFHPVGIERPNPQYAALLQEQLGGGNGELKAAMQYMSQSFRIKDPKIKDLFLDIAAEELGHMEMVAQTIVGNICESGDILAKDRELPKIEQGDVIAIVDKNEYSKLMGFVSKIDPSSFVIVTDAREVLGEGFIEYRQ